MSVSVQASAPTPWEPRSLGRWAKGAPEPLRGLLGGLLPSSSGVKRSAPLGLRASLGLEKPPSLGLLYVSSHGVACVLQSLGQLH